jgi:hypothetical protein
MPDLRILTEGQGDQNPPGFDPLFLLRPLFQIFGFETASFEFLYNANF